jgi:hypothetical protein
MARTNGSGSGKAVPRRSPGSGPCGDLAGTLGTRQSQLPCAGAEPDAQPLSALRRVDPYRGRHFGCPFGLEVHRSEKRVAASSFVPLSAAALAHSMVRVGLLANGFTAPPRSTHEGLPRTPHQSPRRCLSTARSLVTYPCSVVQARPVPSLSFNESLDTVPRRRARSRPDRFPAARFTVWCRSTCSRVRW